MGAIVSDRLIPLTVTTPPRTDTGADRAFLLLRSVFTDDWEGYLTPWVNDIVPGSAHDAMLIVGVIEIVAGLLAGRGASRED
jgi:hypothetical protein